MVGDRGVNGHHVQQHVPVARVIDTESAIRHHHATEQCFVRYVNEI